MKHALSVSLLFFVVVRVVSFFLFAPKLQEGTAVAFTSKILNEPRVTKTETFFTVSVSNIFGGVPVRVILKPTNQFRYQEIVKISGTLTKQALRADSSIMVIADSTIVPVPSVEDKLMQFVLDIRQTVVSAFQKFLPKDNSALLAGIVLGVRGDFGKNFLSALQTTGVMHIVAASGMNVAMVAGFFFPFFTRFFRRQYAVLLVGMLIFFYVLLSGMQSSIIRAGLMMGISLSAQLFGRQYDGLYGLLLAVGLMVLASPAVVLDVGFQLSVGATLGILVIKPLLPTSPIFDDATTTIAAQLTTLPILLVSFGQYGLVSVVVNVAILWTIPMLMALGAAAAASVFIFPLSTGILLACAAPLLWYIQVVVEWFAGIGWKISVVSFPLVMTIGYYLCLFAVVLFVRAKRKLVVS